MSTDMTLQSPPAKPPRLSQAAYEEMVSNVPGMIFRAVSRPGGQVEFNVVSDGCRILLGVAPEELQADSMMLRRMVHPEDSESYETASALAQREVQPWQWQGRFVLPSGEQKHVQARGHPDPQENGDVVWDGFLMDVTDRVQAELQAAQLAAIVEGSDDAILGKTLSGVVTSWNHAAERMYGYTAAEMIGQPLAVLLPPDRPDEVAELISRIAAGEQVQNFETVRRAKDGALLDVALTVSPIRSRAGQIIGASTTARDIRQRKETEAQVQRQILRVQALRNIDMAITASLDLRVTLNVLLDQVTTHLHVNSAAVLLLNAHTYLLEYCVGRGFRAGALQQTRLRIGEGYAGRAALGRCIVSIPDLSQVKDFQRDRLIAGEDFVT